MFMLMLIDVYATISSYEFWTGGVRAAENRELMCGFKR